MDMKIELDKGNLKRANGGCLGKWGAVEKEDQWCKVLYSRQSSKKQDGTTSEEHVRLN
jgi:hypothetical protein